MGLSVNGQVSRLKESCFPDPMPRSAAEELIEQQNAGGNAVH